MQSSKGIASQKWMRANKQWLICHRRSIVVSIVLYHPGSDLRVRMRVRVVQMMKRFEAQFCRLMRKCSINMVVHQKIFRAPILEINLRAHLERLHIVAYSKTVVAVAVAVEVARRGLSHKFQWVFLIVI